MAIVWECKVPKKDNKYIKYKNPIDYINLAKKPTCTNYPLTYFYICQKIKGKYYYAQKIKSKMSLRYKGDNNSIIY